jgi:hypothetical protein
MRLWHGLFALGLYSFAAGILTWLSLFISEQLGSWIFFLPTTGLIGAVVSLVGFRRSSRRAHALAILGLVLCGGFWLFMAFLAVLLVDM